MTGTASAPCVVGGATGTAPAPGVEGIRVSGVPTEAVRDACNPGDWGVSVEFPQHCHQGSPQKSPARRSGAQCSR